MVTIANNRPQTVQRKKSKLEPNDLTWMIQIKDKVNANCVRHSSEQRNCLKFCRSNFYRIRHNFSWKRLFSTRDKNCYRKTEIPFPDLASHHTTEDPSQYENRHKLQRCGPGLGLECLPFISVTLDPTSNGTSGTRFNFITCVCPWASAAHVQATIDVAQPISRLQVTKL